MLNRKTKLGACLCVVVVLLEAGSAADTLPTAAEVIEAAIGYHDPEGRWFESVNELVVKQTRPGGHSSKMVMFTLYPSADRFQLSYAQDGYEVSGKLDGDECAVPDSLTAEEIERFRAFDCKRLRLLYDYYSYLFNAPMNLRDKGGRVNGPVVGEAFEGRDAYRVTVEYGEDQPVWEYYVDPQSCRLLGCRFSDGGSRQNGELIVYEGEVESSGVRLPRKRSWYLHSDGSLIGVDSIEQYVRKSGPCSPGQKEDSRHR